DEPHSHLAADAFLVRLRAPDCDQEAFGRLLEVRDVERLPIVTAGLVMGPRGIGTMVAMMVVGQLVGRLDTRLPVALGLGLTAWPMYEMTGWTHPRRDSVDHGLKSPGGRRPTFADRAAPGPPPDRCLLSGVTGSERRTGGLWAKTPQQ